MALASHSPGGQDLLLHVVAGDNPARDCVPEWTETQIAKRSAELCGKPCLRQLVGTTLRLKLLPKGLVISRKVNHHLLVWAPTEEACRACAARVYAAADAAP